MEINKISIPEGWRKIPISECVVEKKKSPIKVDDAAIFGQYPFFTSGEAVLQHDCKLIDGENLYLATGGMANVKYFNGEAAYSTDTYVLGTKENICPKFMYYVLLFLKQYIDINYFQGSGLKHLQKKDFKRHEIIIPGSKDEQQRIADALSKLDDSLSQTQSLIDKYELIKRGLMQDLLTLGIDKKGNVRSEKTHKFKDSPLGRIPEEWECATFKDVAGNISDYIKTGPFGSSLKGEHWRETGVPVITIGALGEDEFISDNLLFISQEKANELYKYSLKEGDILFSRVADVGRSLIIDKNHVGWIMSSNFMRLRIDTDIINPIIIYLNIKFCGQFKTQINRNVNSSGRAVTNTSILNSLLIPKMDKYEQERIVNTYMRLVATHEAMAREQHSLYNQKQGLLSDLLTGKVRI